MTTETIMHQKLVARSATVGVLGQGYVGLPLALEVSRAGFNTIGFDVSAERVAQLNAGRSHITDVSDDDIAKAIAGGKYRATDDFAELGRCDVIVICVPTPLRKTKDPDISYIVSAVDSIKQHICPPALIVLESTTYPGTTDELVVAELESVGLTLDQDFFACFSPERVDPGNALFQTRNIPKVVGGVSELSTKLGVTFYQQVLEKVHPVSSARVAEMAKLLENTFRAVNIGLVNELALLAERMGVDIWEVIDAAATKPFGYMPFYPGPGIGGHCIPADPMYLAWKGKTYDFYNRFIELADEINSGMPQHVVNRVAELLNMQGLALSRSKVLLLGIAYKKNVGDTRESPAIEIANMLKARGATVRGFDPFVDKLPKEAGDLEMLDKLDEDALRSFDCVVLTTDHDQFDYEWIADNVRLVFDTRNAFRNVDKPHVYRLGTPLRAETVSQVANA